MVDTDDIRVKPFTDEEKARLNEKVRRMRFARPPPKLPQAKRPDTATRIEALPRSSLYAAWKKFSPQSPVDFVKEPLMNDRRVSVDDSGISSCDSRGNTPVYQRSPTEPFDDIHGIPCSAYVCDGCDWVPEELDAAAEFCNVDGFTAHSPVQCSSRSTFVECESSCHEALVKMEEEISAHCCKSECCGVDVVVFKFEDPICPTFPMPPLELSCSAFCRPPPIHSLESTDATVSSTPPVHPIEEIDATSSVIYSKRLENALNKDRGGLLEIPQRIEGKLGRFEEPKYGRSLVTTSAPVGSLNHIMSSTLASLKSFLETGKIAPPEKLGNSEIVSDTAEEELREGYVVQQDIAGLSNPSKRRKRKGKKAHNGNAKRATPSANDSESATVMNGRGTEERTRTVSIVSTTSDSSTKAIKIVIRREIPSEAPVVEHEQEFETATSTSEETPLRSPMPIMVTSSEASSTNSLSASEEAPGDAEGPLCATQLPDEDIKDLPSNTGNDKVITIDDDIAVVHEDIRSKAVEKFRFWNKASFEEAALVVRLSKLMGTGSFDTSDPAWFHILLAKVKEYIRQLDAQNNDAYELMKHLKTSRDYGEREYWHFMRKLKEAKNIVSEEQESTVDTTSTHLFGSPDTSPECESEVRSTGIVAPVEPLRTSLPKTIRRSRNSHVIGKCPPLYLCAIEVNIISFGVKHVLVAGGMQDILTSMAYFLQAQPAYIHREGCKKSRSGLLMEFDSERN